MHNTACALDDLHVLIIALVHTVGLSGSVASSVAISTLHPYYCAVFVIYYVCSVVDILYLLTFGPFLRYWMCVSGMHIYVALLARLRVIKCF